MSRIDELIAELCPQGVEYRALGELLDYVQPNKYLVSSSQYRESFQTPVLTAGQTFILGYTDEVDGVYPASKRAPVIIFDDFTTTFHWVNFPFKAKSSAMKMLFPLPGSRAEFKFIYYAMRCIGFAPKDHGRYWISKYSKFRIPLPPIKVQREIVRVLDSLTELEKEVETQLEAEVQARRRQYHHYRDLLLSFADLRKRAGAVQWKTLNEIGTLKRGRRFTNKDFVERGIPCIHYGEIYTHYGLFAEETKSFVRPELAERLRFAKSGDLVIAGTGESVDEICKAVAWLGEDDVAVHDDCYIFHHSLNPKYAAYVFQSGDFNQQKIKYAAGAKMIRVSSESLAKIRIPVPPLDLQARIVATLDEFGALALDMSICLPAELKCRRQQYAYYLERLLTFREAA